MDKNTLWMLVGCIAPLLLIFLLPLFGITGNYNFIFFIVTMFGCHLMMMGRHGKHHNSKSHQHTNQNEIK